MSGSATKNPEPRATASGHDRAKVATLYLAPSISQIDPKSNMLGAALYYAGLGWPVFPCRPGGKEPLTPNGFKDAVTDPDQIQAWWAKWPEANIGVATGERSGLLVVDIDRDKGGFETREQLTEAHGPLPDTPEAETGGGGRHYFFKHVPGFGCTKDRIGPGIDTRGDGGYVIVPPSRTTGDYLWEVSSHPGEVAPADAPLWLLDLAADTEAEDLPEVEFSANGHTDKPDLSSFNIPELIRSTIRRTPEPNEDRSSIDQSVINSLVRAGASDNQILGVYEHYPIGTGGKFADKGRWGPDYLRRTIAKARKWTAGREAKSDDQADSDSQTFLLSEPADHEGHAQCLHRLYEGQFAYSGVYGWLFNTGTHWEYGQAAESNLDRAIVDVLIQRRVAAVKAELEPVVRASKANRHNVTGTRDLYKSVVTVPVTEFDDDPDLLNTPNGIVHLPTGELLTHDPGQRFTYCLPVTYEPDTIATTEGLRWLDLVSTWVGDDLDKAAYLQLASGYSVTGHTWEECLFYLYGATRAGKGSFIEALLATLGRPLSASLEFQSLTAPRYGDTQNFDLAGLKPSRFVAASESNRYQPLNPAKIKQITGGDHIRAAFKHRDLFEYRPQFKLWLLSNHPTNLDVDDDAAWARVRVIHFPRSYLGREDKRLKHSLKQPESLKAVLAWLVSGAGQWYQSGRGLVEPGIVKADTLGHRDQADYVAQFIEECCTTGGDDKFTAAGTLYREYKNWADDNGVTPKKARQFARALMAKGYERDRKMIGGKYRRGYAGLELN